MLNMNLKRIKEAANFLNKNGYAIIPRYIDSHQCKEAIEEINRLVDSFRPNEEHMSLFNGSKDRKQQKISKYFLESAEKTSFFYETQAWKDGKLVVPQREAFNKIGHNLHEANTIFKAITYADGMWDICQSLNILSPIVMESMAILKPPRIGGQVRIHQDSTFLSSDPDTLLGCWVPLEDATLENGCLWGLPGSHLGPLYRRSRIINELQEEILDHQPDYKQSDFIPLQMQKGSLAIFTGKFLHKSHANHSNKSRYAYTWHLIDSSSSWSATNWLQRSSYPHFPEARKITLPS